MSDTMTRTLTRAARAGDPEAQQRADLAQCRRGRHVWRLGKPSCACGKRSGNPHPKAWEFLCEALPNAEGERAGRIGQRLQDLAERYREDVDAEQLLEAIGFTDSGYYAQSYAEPGYDDPNTGVLLYNWNGCPQRDHVEHALTSAGYELEWSDEWLVCECGKAFRTEPDHMSWTMHGFIGDGVYSCGECALEDPEGTGYLDSLQSSEYREPLDTLGVDLSEHGFGTEPLCEVWSSDAQEVVKHCEQRGWQVVFQRGSYSTRWQVWAKSEADEREPEDIEGPALSPRCARSFPCVRFDVDGGIYSLQD